MASKISREWQLKRENGIRYRVVIENYFDQMDFASRMRKVQSKEFKIGESLFRISIRPDIYSSQRESYVGVFLENLNNWMVQCTWSIRAGARREFKEHQQMFSAQAVRGHPEFLTFRRINQGGILDDAGCLIIEVDVKLLGEEVPASRPDENGGPTLQRVQDQLDKVTEELADMKTASWWRSQKMFVEVKSELTEVKAHLRKAQLLRYLNLTKNNHTNPKCPS